MDGNRNEHDPVGGRRYDDNERAQWPRRRDHSEHRQSSHHPYSHRDHRQDHPHRSHSHHNSPHYYSNRDDHDRPRAPEYHNRHDRDRYPDGGRRSSSHHHSNGFHDGRSRDPHQHHQHYLSRSDRDYNEGYQVGPAVPNDRMDSGFPPTDQSRESFFRHPFPPLPVLPRPLDPAFPPRDLNYFGQKFFPKFIDPSARSILPRPPDYPAAVPADGPRLHGSGSLLPAPRPYLPLHSGGGGGMFFDGPYEQNQRNYPFPPPPFPPSLISSESIHPVPPSHHNHHQNEPLQNDPHPHHHHHGSRHSRNRKKQKRNDAIPEGWEECTPFGRVVEGTRIVPVKAPLSVQRFGKHFDGKFLKQRGPNNNNNRNPPRKQEPPVKQSMLPIVESDPEDDPTATTTSTTTSTAELTVPNDVANSTDAPSADSAGGPESDSPTPERSREPIVFTPQSFAEIENGRVGLVIDLTFTDRYYSADELKWDLPSNGENDPVDDHSSKSWKPRFEKWDQQYWHAPPRNLVERFIATVSNFQDQHPNEYICVHCTHGHNRTGFFIASFLVEKCGLTVSDALERFRAARPNGLYDPVYIDALYEQYNQTSDPLYVTKSYPAQPWKSKRNPGPKYLRGGKTDSVSVTETESKESGLLIGSENVEAQTPEIKNSADVDTSLLTAPSTMSVSALADF